MVRLHQRHMLVSSGRIEGLRSNIIRALSGSISEQELTDFVQFSRVLIESHLRCLRRSSGILCQSQGITLTDLAYDCIAEAFARDRNAMFCSLQTFVAALWQPIEDLPSHELFLAYKGFLVKLADSQLARLFALSDPAGAKIHRNIRDCLKSGRYFLLQKDFRGFALTPKSSDAFDDRPPYPFDELSRQFAACATGCTMIPQLLGVLHGIVCEQSAYRRSIPLADVVQLFKTVYREDADDPTRTLSAPGDLEGLTEFEIERMRLQVEVTLKEKILLTYLARGKMDRDEAEAVFKAFHDLLLGWCSSDGADMSLSDYLSRHISLRENEYESRYRIKMEYLLKIMREEFASRLLREI